MKLQSRWVRMAIPALVAGMALCAPAAAQTSGTDLQSLSIDPVGTTSNDPNNGRWFAIEAKPGDVVTKSARFTNVEDQPQTARLFLADLDFSNDGTPLVVDKASDVGTWGGFTPSVITVGPKASIEVPFKITVPGDAEPGDHVGAVVAETTGPEAGASQLQVVKRIAIRMYVTLPGVAPARVSIEKVELERDSTFLTREITTKILVRNDGRVRLRPTVLVNGKRAAGSDILLSKSVESYLITEKVPLWGGPRSSRVDVQTRVGDISGPARQARVSVFVIPWVLFILLGFGFVVLWTLRRIWRRRGSKYAEMRADMKRIERLLAEQRAGEPIETRDDDPEVAIKAAIKRAGRAGDKESEEKLKEKLAEHRAASAPADSEPEPVVATTPQPEPEPAPEPVVATTPQPEPEPAPEPVVATTPQPEPEPAPEPVVATTPQPEPVAAADTSSYDWLLEDSPPVAPVSAPRTPVQSAMGPGYFVPDPALPPAPVPAQPEVTEEPEPMPAEPDPVVATTPPPEPVAAAPKHADAAPSGEQEDTLAAVLKELQTAPKKRQEALLQAARSYGVLTLRSHADLIEQLPPEVKVKLLPKQWAI